MSNDETWRKLFKKHAIIAKYKKLLQQNLSERNSINQINAEEAIPRDRIQTKICQMATGTKNSSINLQTCVGNCKKTTSAVAFILPQENSENLRTKIYAKQYTYVIKYKLANEDKNYAQIRLHRQTKNAVYLRCCQNQCAKISFTIISPIVTERMVQVWSN